MAATASGPGALRGLHRLPVVVHVVGVVVAIGVAFAVFQGPFRHLESLAAVGLCNLFGFTGVKDSTGNLFLVQGSNHPAFWVVITPSCSSLSSLLCLAGLSTFITPRARRGVSTRRFVAAVAASLCVLFLGNLLRIDFSVLVGLAAGSVSEVLFHNWVGSVFGFASLLAGWILLLWLLLPGERVRLAGVADRPRRVVARAKLAARRGA